MEDIGSRSGARAVSVLYTGGQLFTQNSAGVPSRATCSIVLPQSTIQTCLQRRTPRRSLVRAQGERRVANQAPAAVELQNPMTVRCSRKVALLSIGSLPITGIDHFRIRTFCSSRLAFTSGTATRTLHNT